MTQDQDLATPMLASSTRADSLALASESEVRRMVTNMTNFEPANKPRGEVIRPLAQVHAMR
jgi:hypothetical protein